MQRVCLIALLWLAAAGGAWGANIAPSSASGAAIPYPYNVGIYTTWPSDPISIAAISDGSAATSVALTGLDNVLQDNGVWVDTGTFYLLRYELPPETPGFHIEFTADVQYPGGDELLVEAIQGDGVTTRTVFSERDASQPRTFGLTFYRFSNDGNQGDWGQAWGLDDLRQPDGSILIVLQGSYFAQYDRPGFVTSTLYDVSATVVAPEPSAGLLLAIGALAALAMGRRRSSRGPGFPPVS
ncbi:MAG: PEP-CTERM sorting domain-containing protein [Pirellulales bacterium]